MPDTISLTGVVATTPRHITTNEGLDITSFRLASSQRRYDRAKNLWVDAGTNWYTVTAFRQLAANMAVSLTKGDRVVASGRVRLRDWSNAEKNGTTVEVEADAVGHDLTWGSASFSRTVQSPGSGHSSASEGGGGSAGAADGWATPAAPAAAASGGDWGAPPPTLGDDGFLPVSGGGQPVPVESGSADSEFHSADAHLDSTR